MPEIGWLGVIAIAAWLTYVVAGLRSTILVALSFLFFGIVGLWPDSMDIADHHRAVRAVLDA